MESNVWDGMCHSPPPVLLSSVFHCQQVIFQKGSERATCQHRAFNISSY